MLLGRWLESKGGVFLLLLLLLLLLMLLLIFSFRDDDCAWTAGDGCRWIVRGMWRRMRGVRGGHGGRALQQQASNQGEGDPKAQKRELHGFDRALAICCVCMEAKCQPVSAHVVLYVYVCV